MRIVIADDHRIFRAGLRRLLEAEPGFEVVGEAADGTEVAALVEKLRPDILLLDVAMPRMPGLEVLGALAERGAPVRTIVLTAAIDRTAFVKALQLGAWGVVMKEAATDLLFKSIRSVMAGQYWVGRETVSDLVQALREPEPAAAPGPRQTFDLTARELEVLSAVVGGRTNREVAQKFSLSEDTVKHHLTNIFDRMGVSKRLELALFATHHRLIPT